MEPTPVTFDLSWGVISLPIKHTPWNYLLSRDFKKQSSWLHQLWSTQGEVLWIAVCAIYGCILHYKKVCNMQV